MMIMAVMFLFVHSDTFAVWCIV